MITEQQMQPFEKPGELILIIIGTITVLPFKRMKINTLQKRICILKLLLKALGLTQRA